MNLKKYKTRVSVMIIVAAVILTLLCLLTVYSFHTGEEATVGISSSPKDSKSQALARCIIMSYETSYALTLQNNGNKDNNTIDGR